MHNEKIYFNPILIKKKQITEKYTYTPYTLPTAPDLPAITPRRKIQIIPKSHEIRNVGDKVHEIEKTTILTCPHDHIKDLRREVRESDERLLFVKSGHSLDRLNFNNNREFCCDIQETQTLNLKERSLEAPNSSRRSARKNSNVYVYRENSMSTGPASEIQNGFNIMRHNINEMNRKRYNKIAKELNLRTKRRPFELHQMFDDMEKYGIEESIARAKRARQYSSLKLKNDELWWEEFINSIPEELRTAKTTKFINKFGNIRFYNEENITKFIFDFTKTDELHEICYTLMKLANKVGSFFNDDRLEYIFYKAEKRRKEKENLIENTIQ